MTRAMKAWDYANIKAIGYAEIEDFIFAQNVSDKTKANIRSCLHDFWTWLRKRRVITLQQVPEFPDVSYELGYRNIIEIDTQQAIIAEIRRLTWDINPKIYMAVRWLSVYIAVRPGELIGIQEKHIRYSDGIIIVPHVKDKKPKVIYLLDEDIELLNSIPRGLPDLHFFRHPAGISGCKAGQKFGPRYLYKWWIKACNNLGVAGVDMYGGTRHSTASALATVLDPSEIKTHGTQHSTNKAFERYFQRKASHSLKVSKAVTGLQQVYNIKDGVEKDKILKLKD
jgi:integrase